MGITVAGEDVRFFHTRKSGVDRIWIDRCAPTDDAQIRAARLMGVMAEKVKSLYQCRGNLAWSEYGDCIDTWVFILGRAITVFKTSSLESFKKGLHAKP